MNTQNFLLEAIDVVLAWDISDEAFADAVVAQSGFMARTSPDEISGLYSY
ncbi:hypothetical protein [Candidatus Nitrotoga sp. 1052]|nr:hypothetical protein [Candidatus Nitrotoga sp. 1052]CAH1087074.1 conserved hypothetical protein [Candidatus Nitrotoga sp. 1052]